jgi:hypothetical protein
MHSYTPNQVMVAVSTFVTKILWDEFMEEKDGSEQVKERARELREQLVKLGPTFVKVRRAHAHLMESLCARACIYVCVCVCIYI